MAAAIEDAYPSAQVVLKPGGRGDFIVSCAEQIMWDKRKEGDHFPEEADMIRRLQTLLQ